MEKTQILIIDDEQPVLAFFCAAADRCNLEVTTCTLGAEAVAAMAQQTFAAVFIDTEMPDMDGLQTLLAIRKGHPKMPCFMMTVCPTSLILDKALQAGATGAVFKPPDLDKIIASIQKVEVVQFFAGELQRALARSQGSETPATRAAESMLHAAEQLEGGASAKTPVER
jgi:DNA-binding NtrC family response regulator